MKGVLMDCYRKDGLRHCETLTPLEKTSFLKGVESGRFGPVDGSLEKMVSVGLSLSIRYERRI